MEKIFDREKAQVSRPRGQCILFSVVFTPSPPSHHGSVWVLPVIFLLVNKHSIDGAGLPVLMIGLERFRGIQKDDDRGPLSIQSYLVSNIEDSRSGPRFPSISFISHCFYSSICSNLCRDSIHYIIPLSFTTFLKEESPEAKFIVPDWGI
jgi:hypothetical protein